jgi:hypothetical protein
MPKHKNDLIRVESVEGRLRLRWSNAGRRYCLALGYPDTASNRGFAQLKAAQIQRDIEYREFDLSLKKYRSKRDVLGTARTKRSTLLKLFGHRLIKRAMPIL